MLGHPVAHEIHKLAVRGPVSSIMTGNELSHPPGKLSMGGAMIGQSWKAGGLH
jgi:hypothetical protein